MVRLFWGYNCYIFQSWSIRNIYLFKTLHIDSTLNSDLNSATDEFHDVRICMYCLLIFISNLHVLLVSIHLFFKKLKHAFFKFIQFFITNIIFLVIVIISNMCHNISNHMFFFKILSTHLCPKQCLFWSSVPTEFVYQWIVISVTFQCVSLTLWSSI